MAANKDDSAYYQQIHRDCGGEIVIAARNRRVTFICKLCQTHWKLDFFQVIETAPDWQDCEAPHAE